jgi:hypothetical protein
VQTAADRLRAVPDLRATLYLTSANEDGIVQPTRELAAAVAQAALRGVVCHHQPMPEQFHDTIYRASAPRALRTVFAAPAEAK